MLKTVISSNNDLFFTSSFKILFLLSLSFVFQPVSKAQSLQRYEFQSHHMGTTFNLTFYAPNDSVANQAQEQAFSHVEKLNSILSDYDPNSNLNQLSAKSGTCSFFKIDATLFKVLSQAQKIAYETEGAFDITVGPAVDLWRKIRKAKNPQLPSKHKLQQLKSRMGYQYLKVDSSSTRVALTHPQMKLDLGGIAKGFAADEMLRILKQSNIHAALIDAGGDIRLGDPPPGKEHWTITIPGHTQDGSRQWITLRLANQAIATSGGLFQHVVIDGKQYSHIIDPRTGIGLTDHSMVTIVAPNGIIADSYASAVSVLGAKDGMLFINNKPHVNLRIEYQENGSIIIQKSPGFDMLTID